MRRIVLTTCFALAVLAADVPHAWSVPSGPGYIASLVRTIDTSAFTPASPDPADLTYRAGSGRILVADSEVDEMPALFTGAQTFEFPPADGLADTGSLVAKTNEPSGVAWDEGGKRLYVADDDLDKVFRFNPGADGRFGTADDSSSTLFNTSPFGSDDAEGLAWDPSDRSLWLSDGTASRIFHIERGLDGVFGGSATSPSDDIVTSFDAIAAGARDPEDLEVDLATGSLWVISGLNKTIAEMSKSGALIALYDISGSGIVNGAGITLAPGGAAPNETHIYVSDRNVDNDVDPSENDGRIFEFALSEVPTNEPPVLTNPGSQFSVEGDAVSLDLVATDPNEDAISFDATNLPDGLSVDPGTGRISGTVSVGASANAPFAVTITATDPGGLIDSESFSWRVTAGNRPPTLQSPPDQDMTEGTEVSLQLVASDPDGDPLVFDATNLPPGLFIDQGIGLISGTVAQGAAIGSPYVVEVEVRDPGDLFDRKTMRWSIQPAPPNEPPVVTNPGPQSNGEGDSVALPITATDHENDPLSYSATGLPPGLAIEPATGEIAGTIASGANTGSPYTVTVSASDELGTGTASFDWVVTDRTAPAQPAGLMVTGDSTALRLDWADNTESDLAGYDVFRLDGGGAPVKLNGSRSSLSGYVDTAAPPGVASTYRVIAVDTNGNASLPAEATATRSKIAFVGASDATAKNLNQLTVPLPAGVQTGDVVVASIDVTGTTSVAGPSGWQSPISNVLVGTALRQVVYVHTVGNLATEGTSYRWTFGARSSSTGMVVVYRGVDPNQPVIANAWQTRTKANTIPLPALQNPTPGSLLVGALGITTNATIGAPTGMLLQRSASMPPPAKPRAALTDDVLESIGSSGARNAPASKGGNSVGQVLILRPVA
jgi:hypothetical protein